MWCGGGGGGGLFLFFWGLLWCLLGGVVVEGKKALGIKQERKRWCVGKEERKTERFLRLLPSLSPKIFEKRSRNSPIQTPYPGRNKHPFDIQKYRGCKR